MRKNPYQWQKLTLGVWPSVINTVYADAPTDNSPAPVSMADDTTKAKQVESLYLRKTAVTDERIKHIKKALPRLEVNCRTPLVIPLLNLRRHMLVQPKNTQHPRLASMDVRALRIIDACAPIRPAAARVAGR
jgi:hypothetical protein